MAACAVKFSLWFFVDLSVKQAEMSLTVEHLGTKPVFDFQAKRRLQMPKT